jgi:molybdenum cofactor biosynthesis enzyme MoaA
LPKSSSRQQFLCPLPWSHIATTPGGSVRLCCDSTGEESRSKNEHGKDYKIYRDSPEEFLNSENFKNIRRKMISGDVPSSCQNCFAREEETGDSPRLHFLNKYDFSLKKAEEQTLEEGILDEYTVKSVDLRLGNNCNLKCRMCNPWSSLSLGDEFRDLYNESVPSLDWPDESDDWVNLLQKQNSLEDLYLTGGEPTLIQNNLRLLKGMNQQQRDKVKVRVNTNATIFNTKFFEEMRLFKSNDVKLSLDGVGRVNDYIRFPSKWSSILNNIKLMQRLEGLKISTHLTLSSYNLLSLRKTLEKFEEIGLPFPFIDFVRDPSELSIFSLPPIFKEKFLEQEKSSDSLIVKKVGESIGKSYLPSTYEALKKRTAAVDKYRSTYLKDYIPEVGKLLE